MESHWAAEHLQVIRTLMERSAVYRRALAPVMTWNGGLGILAAAAGVLARLESPRAFIGYWMLVAVVATAGALALIRRQALKAAEPFWSPPMRRVAQAALPPFVCGFALGAVLFLRSGADASPGLAALSRHWLPLFWVALYGCGLHAAGFFMLRGTKLFGWAFVAGSAVLCLAAAPNQECCSWFGHGLMGLFFGVAQLAYGIYLYFTEPRGTEP